MRKHSSTVVGLATAMAVLAAACAAPPAAAPQAPAQPAQPAATEAPAPAPVPAASPKGGLRKSNSDYKGTLNLWVLGYTPGNQFANPFDLAIAQFEADNPDINVEITGYPPNDEGFTKLTTALQSGQGIDLLRLPSDRLPAFVKDDLIAPIDDYLTDADKADILPNTLDAVRLKDGKAYAWPLWVVPMGIYLNLDVFQEAGVELPSKDWTWEEFVETAKKLTFQRANGEQVYGFSGFIDPGVINTWGLWMNEDPSIRPIVDGKFGFDNEKAAAGLKRFAELALVHKVTPPDFGSQKDADVKGGFKNKQYAMIVDATGFSPQLKADKINFAIYPLPSQNGNRLTVGAIGLIAVAATNDKAKERAAMDLARYLTSAEVQEDVPPSETAATGFYLAPAARRSVKVAPPLDQFVPMLDYMWITPLTPAWPKLTRLFHPEYQNIIFGKADPAEAMAKIAPEANALIAGQ
ncbi:MAG: sugar ABC transporter substrate-binding protein [Anaerolineae bacterium]|nr:sugar ABC transporter substrate-binding protein [Anaerolineae bacterium]